MPDDQECQAEMGFLGFRVQKESQDVKESQAIRECPDHLGKQGPKGHEDRLENQSPECRVRKAFLGR